MVITLIGYRGSGKSSVAGLLAEAIHRPWVDTDHLVEETTGRSIRQIFEDDGEDEFRRLEQVALAQAIQRGSIVIAAGGGAILRDANRQAMKDAGPVVWLQASAKILADRIGQDDSTRQRRPSLTGQSVLDEVASVLAERLPLYAEAATVTIGTDGLRPEQVVEEIRKRLEIPESP